MSKKKAGKPTAASYAGEIDKGAPTYTIVRKKPGGPPALSVGDCVLDLEGAERVAGVPQTVVDALPAGFWRARRERVKR